MTKFHRLILPRCTLILSESEIYELLKSNERIWMDGIKRGKAFKRYEDKSAQYEQKLANHENEILNKHVQ